MITPINRITMPLFEMTGKDVTTFLNNQVVSELNPITEVPRLTAICNPKGRIIFTLILLVKDETTYVAVDASLSDNFLQYVNMRRFRMEININKSNFMLGIQGASQTPNIAQNLVLTDDDELVVATEQDFWFFMFKAGLPWITAASSETYIPQHLNLDQLKVIDFDKGCYPGQEIVARLHFLGKVKKRMQYVKYQADSPFAINSKYLIEEYEAPLEFCSPAFYHDKRWHSQAIIAL